MPQNRQECKGCVRRAGIAYPVSVVGKGKDPDLTALDLAVTGEIRAIAARKGISQARLREMTGIGRTRLRETVYADQRTLKVSELDAISQALGLSVAELVRLAEQNIDQGSEPSDPGTTLRALPEAARAGERERGELEE